MKPRLKARLKARLRAASSPLPLHVPRAEPRGRHPTSWALDEAEAVLALQLEAAVRAQEKTPAGEPADEVIVGLDQYELTRQPPPEGLPLLVRLNASGGEVGAVSLRFRRAETLKSDLAFKVVKVIEPPCVEVTDYSNKDSKAKSEVYNWDGLSLRLGGHDFRLRLGDHGDSLLATLTFDEKK